MRVGIVAQRGNAHATFLASELYDTFGSDAEIWVDSATAESMDVDGVSVGEMDRCDLLVSIGGDGTFLFTARNGGETPVMGVNLGEVGFLNAVSPEDAVEAVGTAIERYRDHGDVPCREIPRVGATGDDWTLEPGINEIVVHGPRRGHGYGVGIEVRVDGSLYTGSHADGVLIATPTGSTAYNLSEGGPLVHPAVDGLIVTEMCAGEPMPPLVVDRDSEITVRVTDAPSGVVVSDGRSQQEVDPPERIRVRVADEPVRIAGPPVDFFEALEKLE